MSTLADVFLLGPRGQDAKLTFCVNHSSKMTCRALVPSRVVMAEICVLHEAFIKNGQLGHCFQAVLWCLKFVFCMRHSSKMTFLTIAPRPCDDACNLCFAWSIRGKWPVRALLPGRAAMIDICIWHEAFATHDLSWHVGLGSEIWEKLCECNNFRNFRWVARPPPNRPKQGQINPEQGH